MNLKIIRIIEFIPSNKIEQFNIILYANLLRFFQNNKSYKYLYIKENRTKL